MTSPHLNAAEQWFDRHDLAVTERSGRHEPLAGWSWRPRLQDYDLWLVRRGRGEARLDGAPPVPLGPGTLLLLRPGDSGAITQDESNPVAVTFCHFRVLERASGAPTSIPPELSPGRVHHLEPTGPTAAALEALVRSSSPGRPMGLLRSRGQLAQLVAAIYTLPSHRPAASAERDDAIARRAIAIIDGDPGRRRTVADIAAAVGIRDRALAPLLREAVGMSFREYVLESRLRRAQVLIGETDLPISTIARMLGYSDHVLLSKQFQARFGRSPRDYRRS